jgi:hypothetical protein
MHYLDPREPSAAPAVEASVEALLDIAQPGWRDVLAQRRYLPRMQAASALPAAAQGGLAGRPGPRVAGLPNVLLAGDWVGPQGWLVDASLGSAREAARSILGRQTTGAGRGHARGGRPSVRAA